MPPEKEVNFFSEDENFSKGMNWYLKEYFASNDSSKLRGEASVEYMCYDYVPKRIFSVLPDIKLISILRNPIDRAYSHYRMAVRRKLENLHFDICVGKLIQRGIVPDKLVDRERDFLMFGEYGRILSNYLRYFSKDQFKIVFTEELMNQPNAVMKDLFNFLEISNDISSEIFGKQYHVSGEKRFGILENILLSRFVKKPLRLVLPSQLRRYFGYWLITQFTVKPTKDHGPSSEIRHTVADYYRKDVALLRSLFKLKPPWEDFI